jgi:hypothetical protein
LYIEDLRYRSALSFLIKKKTEQSESILRNSTRLLSTGSSPELAEGSRSTVFWASGGADPPWAEHLQFFTTCLSEKMD